MHLATYLRPEKLIQKVSLSPNSAIQDLFTNSGNKTR